MMHRNKSVDVHQFAMVPHPDIPRSSFRMQKTVKTTFDAGYLVPVFCEEVLPGDTFRLNMTAFARLSTPIAPVMDNMYLDSFFFFVPNRLVWSNWVKFMGEQANPGDSISYTVPQMVCPAGGYAIGSLQDYFGLPTVGQVGAGNTVSHNSLPLRAYNLIYNQWFRDENLCSGAVVGSGLGDGPDTYSSYILLRRGKRHDYFTSALPWTQKGAAVTMPLGSVAPVLPNPASGSKPTFTDGLGTPYVSSLNAAPADANVKWNSGAYSGGAPIQMLWGDPGLYADLSAATAATINSLRQSFQIQRLLERDARGGTRYTEKVRAHFGVSMPDLNWRAEYLGGGSTPIVINPIAQTSATGLTGGSTPGGTLNAMGTALAQGHGFTHSFLEHGYVIGLVNVRADLTYQQGLRRHWSRSTMYDYYFPAFAMLGEQGILNKEIYCKGDSNDALVFGYQERWGEMRYLPSEITGLFRSTAAGTIDLWHLAQNFTALPTLNQTFIQESPPVSRVVAVGAAANGKQFIFDSFFDIHAARPLPMYSVPGLIDHF